PKSPGSTRRTICTGLGESEALRPEHGRQSRERDRPLASYQFVASDTHHRLEPTSSLGDSSQEKARFLTPTILLVGLSTPVFAWLRRHQNPILLGWHCFQFYDPAGYMEAQ